MSGNDIAVSRVVSVLLADGWHRIVGWQRERRRQPLGEDTASPVASGLPVAALPPAAS